MGSSGSLSEEYPESESPPAVYIFEDESSSSEDSLLSSDSLPKEASGRPKSSDSSLLLSGPDFLSSSSFCNSLPSIMMFISEYVDPKLTNC